MARPSVLLADDHQIVADGLRSLLERDFELLGSVGDGVSLVEVARRLEPDVIVSDIAMPRLSGLDALREINTLGLRSRAIILTMLDDPELAVEAFRLGAWAFLLKSTAGQNLTDTIYYVLEQQSAVARTPNHVRIAIADVSHEEQARLTRRQQQVVQLIGEGRSMKEIAAALNVSTRTVESYKYGAMALLRVRNTAELIRYALRESNAAMAASASAMSRAVTSAQATVKRSALLWMQSELLRSRMSELLAEARRQTDEKPPMLAALRDAVREFASNAQKAGATPTEATNTVKHLLLENATVDARDVVEIARASETWVAEVYAA